MDNYQVMANALIVAMETMLAQIREETADPTVLSEDTLNKTNIIKETLEKALGELNAFLVDGDHTHVVRAGRSMMEAQALVGDDPFEGL